MSTPLEQRVDRLQALEVGVDVDAAVPVQELEPRMSARSAGWRRRFAASASSRSAGRFSASVQSRCSQSGVVAQPGLAAPTLVRERPLAEPDLVEDARDHDHVARLARRGTREREVLGRVDVERPLWRHLVAADVVGLEAALEDDVAPEDVDGAVPHPERLELVRRRQPVVLEVRLEPVALEPLQLQRVVGGVAPRDRDDRLGAGALEQRDRAGDVLGRSERRRALDDRERVEVAELLGARAARTRGAGGLGRELGGRRSATTSSPSASARISSSSLESATTRSSRPRARSRARGGRASGRRARARFFRGTRVEPPRAGTRPSTFIALQLRDHRRRRRGERVPVGLARLGRAGAGSPSARRARQPLGDRLEPGRRRRRRAPCRGSGSTGGRSWPRPRPALASAQRSAGRARRRTRGRPRRVIRRIDSSVARTSSRWSIVWQRSTRSQRRPPAS